MLSDKVIHKTIQWNSFVKYQVGKENFSNRYHVAGYLELGVVRQWRMFANRYEGFF